MLKKYKLVFIFICLLTLLSCNNIDENQNKKNEDTRDSEITEIKVYEVDSHNARVDTDINEESYETISVYDSPKYGERKSSVIVDVGFSDRNYIAHSNKFKQLNLITIDEINLLDNEELSKNTNIYSEENSYKNDKTRLCLISENMGVIPNIYSSLSLSDECYNSISELLLSLEDSLKFGSKIKDMEISIDYENDESEFPKTITYKYSLDDKDYKISFDNEM